MQGFCDIYTQTQKLKLWILTIVDTYFASKNETKLLC